MLITDSVQTLYST